MWGETAFLWERAKVLRSVPIAILVIIAALDSADKALLAASFPMLETTLGLHGMFSWKMRPPSLLRYLLSSWIRPQYRALVHVNFSRYAGIFLPLHEFILRVIPPVLGVVGTSLQGAECP